MSPLPTLPVFLLEHGMNIVPGITAMMVVFYDEETGSEIMLQKENYSTAAPKAVDSFDSTLVKPSNPKQPWQWLTESEMPLRRPYNVRPQNATLWDEEKIKNLQINIFGENHQRIIVCYFTFSESQGLFGSSGDSKLSAVNKHFLANITTNYLQQLQKHYQSMVRIIEEQKGYVSSVENQLKNLYSRLQTSQHREREWIRMFCRLKLRQLLNQLQIAVQINEAAIEQLISLNYDADTLEKILTQSIHRLRNFNPTATNLTLEPWHVMAEPLPTVTEPVVQADKPKDKAEALLDKLEQAGKRVAEKNLKLTSVNVGLHCDEPITAPAITDALSKNASRITRLLEKYPNRWTLLRTEFKPLQNIVDRETRRFDTG